MTKTAIQSVTGGPEGEELGQEHCDLMEPPMLVMSRLWAGAPGGLPDPRNPPVGTAPARARCSSHRQSHGQRGGENPPAVKGAPGGHGGPAGQPGTAPRLLSSAGPGGPPGPRQARGHLLPGVKGSSGWDSVGTGTGEWLGGHWGEGRWRGVAGPPQVTMGRLGGGMPGS